MPDRAEDPVQRSIHDFHEALESLHSVGVSPIAEAAYLQILIRKHPAMARHIFAALNTETEPPT